MVVIIAPKYLDNASKISLENNQFKTEHDVHHFLEEKKICQRESFLYSFRSHKE